MTEPLDLDADQKLCDAAGDDIIFYAQGPLANAEFLAVCRNRLPRYIARVREAQEERAAVRDILQKAEACRERMRERIAEQADSIRDGAVRETSERRRADKAERRIAELQDERDSVMRFMDSVREAARNRNPEGATVLDFMACWNEQYQQRIAELEAELAALKSRDAAAAARLNELMLSEAAGRRANQ